MNTEQVEIEVVKLKAKLGRLGLIKTMHAMETVTNTLGWEIAEKRELEETLREQAKSRQDRKKWHIHRLRKDGFCRCGIAIKRKE